MFQSNVLNKFRKQIVFFLRICLLICIFVATNPFIFITMTEGYKVKAYGQPVKRYVQVMDLKDDAELMAQYRKAHSREDFWREIKEGIQQVGILEMELYIVGNRVVMIVETPLDFDWDSAMARLATLPRQQEWEDYVAVFQQCKAGETSDEKWKMTERCFYLYD